MNYCKCGCGQRTENSYVRWHHLNPYRTAKADGEVIEKIKLTVAVSSNGCWEWTGLLDRNGYGKMSYQGKLMFVHRVSYSLFRGEIPRGMNVCHKCDNPKCVCPDHLFLGTQKDNMHDCIRKGRRNSHKRRKLTNEQASEVRDRLLRGEGQLSIANDFHVSQATVSLIKLNKRYQ